jgi:hypothetical protein
VTLAFSPECDMYRDDIENRLSQPAILKMIPYTVNNYYNPKITVIAITLQIANYVERRHVLCAGMVGFEPLCNLAKL